ncbi:MAG: ribosome small subunit-dependent GTPase A, partial [Malacoplasma sp.]|nr:ribosome small subunit-dependent GTPase A [Malacoplasma sp.]
MQGKVLFKIANSFLLNDFESKEKIKAVIRKKTKSQFTILVGDNVIYEKDKYEDFVIEKILERNNFLIRPKVANVNAVCIVFSVKEPEFSSYSLNKFLAFYESRNVDFVLIYFSKMDLLNNDELKKMNEIILEYKKNNYIIFTSNEKNICKKEILKLVKNKTMCFAGQSGVGKSTLINYLVPDLHLKTQEISKSLNRGKHTTTSSFVFPFNEGFIVDTPGFSSLDLNMSQLELASAFTDFRKNAIYCKFKNCLHLNEINCHIKSLVNAKKIYHQRYLDYQKMMSE